ncbi:MAG: hypothetical protein JWN71_2790 [Xanthobacteraceae bacterium]|nr:hypothetical protein [Xanthobacteraceae bacterium]
MAKRPPPQPWHPAPYEDADTAAIQALIAGNANASQQQRALVWIINVLCGTYDQPYRPGSDRDTVFACAKQFVGQQIVKQTKVARE